MAGAPGSHVVVAPNGASTYSSGGVVRYDLSQLASLQGPPPRKSYIRSFGMNVDQNLVQSTGTELMAWQRFYQIISSVILQMQGHQFINLPFSGGQSLRLLNFIMFGKAPTVATSVSFTSGAAQTIYTKFIIPCYDPRLVSSSDDNQEMNILPVGILTGTYLQVTFAASTIYNGTGTWTISTSLTKIRTLTAEIVQLTEVRYPALWAWEERNQAAATDFVTPEGVLYTDIHMTVIPSATADLVADILTASQITNIIFTNQNGLKAIDNLTGGDVQTLYNQQQAMSSEGYCPNFESNLADFIPLQYVPRSSGCKGHIQPDLSKPYLQVSGAVSTTAAGGFRLLLGYTKPTGPRTVADLAAKANQPLPAGFTANPKSYLQAKGSFGAGTSFHAQVIGTPSASSGVAPVQGS